MLRPRRHLLLRALATLSSSAPRPHAHRSNHNGSSGSNGNNGNSGSGGSIITDLIQSPSSHAFNPAIIRYLKRSQDDFANSRLKGHFMRIVKQSQQLLRHVSKGKFVSPGGHLRRHIISERVSQPEIFEDLRTLSTPQDLQACAVGAVVLLPKAKALIELDIIFAKSVERLMLGVKEGSSGETVKAVRPSLLESFEVPIFSSYALMATCAERGIDVHQLKTPTLVMSLLARRCGSGNSREARLDSILPLPLIDPSTTTTSNSQALTNTIDQLALCMYVLANVRPKLQLADDSRALLSLIAQRCQRILETAAAAGHAVEISSLRLIWEAAAGLQLPNAYSMYKVMYETVLLSMQRDPLQMTNQEEAITTLLESMYTSRFKHSKLIYALGDHIRSQGNRFDRCGARMFSALVALENMPLALELLDIMMKTVADTPSSVQGYGHKALSGKGGASFLSLSQEGMLRIEDFLEASGGGSEGTTVSGLILALHCFSREDRGTRYYQLLESMEIEMLTKLPSLPKHAVINLLHAYGSVTRVHPQTVSLIMQRVEAELPNMNKMELRTVLWGHARLNVRASYISRAAELFFAKFTQHSGINSLSTVGYSQVVVTLWSLACLESLSYQQYVQVEPLLLSAYRKYAAPSPALIQVLAELRFGNGGNTSNSAAVSYSSTSSSSSSSNIIDGSSSSNGSSSSFMSRHAVKSLAAVTPTTAASKPVTEPWPKIAFDAAMNTVLTGSLDLLPVLRGAAAPHPPPAPRDDDDSSLVVRSSSSVRRYPTQPDSAEAAPAGAMSSSADLKKPEFESVWALRPWEHARGDQKGSFNSSKTHLKISALLERMSIPHTNEAEIGYGYIVDIFIPGAVPGGQNGTVLEIDGPFHFDSYRQLPIGPTVMKRRHLQALGFKVVSIPYTSWKWIHTDSEKMKAMIRQHLS